MKEATFLFEKSWKIAINPNEFKKGDLITSDKNGYLLEIVKVYKMNWFKRLLTFLHIKSNWFSGVKVKVFDKF